MPSLLPRHALAAALLALPVAAHEPGTLAGRVRDAAGAPIPSVAVEVRGGGADGPLRLQTDAAGRFMTSGLRPGRYQVGFRHPAFLGAKRAVDLVSGHAAEVEQVLFPYSVQVEVTERAGVVSTANLEEPLNHLLGIADSASEGIVTPRQVQSRAYQRPSDILETVPGLLISQHSGQGKANQYYLRGFNLDHGTDLASFVAGMPVNLPTHAHGQGYSDLNFLIPELVGRIQYRKGPYFAEEGDFSAAGAVHLDLLHRVEAPFASLEGGAFGYRRALAAGSFAVGSGALLYAAEGLQNDGPWEHGDAYRKGNALVRFSWSGPDTRYALTAMHYGATWDATDQVPLRAVDRGLIGRFGSLDPTDGGRTRRQSLSFEAERATRSTTDRLEAYVIRTRLNLFSNFTYFLEDATRGDQFEQADRRTVAGFRASRAWAFEAGGRPMEATFGLQVRSDNIAGIGLYPTQARMRLGTTREDAVLQVSVAPYLQVKAVWSEVFRTTLGLRQDVYHFDVRAGLARNGGTRTESLTTPKFSAAFGPWRDTEAYLNVGAGFHSNDGRGTTQRVDPASGRPAAPATPLVRATGVEVGLRSTRLARWQTTVTLWRLDIGSELVFGGDGGTTEASRPSRRMGVEWSNEVQLSPWASLQADLAYSRARFRDAEPAGDRIPGAVEGVGQVGLVLRPQARVQAGVHVRYFGPRPLLEDNHVRARAATEVQADFRYDLHPRLRLHLEGFNLADARASDAAYFYESRLPGEPAPVPDVHFHPVEPRGARLGLTWRF